METTDRSNDRPKSLNNHRGKQDVKSPEADLQAIRDALKGLRFGNVNVIVQDGVIVQIERTEKHRLR
jgi:hypothetical protein